MRPLWEVLRAAESPEEARPYPPGCVVVECRRGDVGMALGWGVRGGAGVVCHQVVGCVGGVRGGMGLALGPGVAAGCVGMLE